ncbi:protein rolling stone-like isoform X2 [Oratosquilla oratoria]
MGCSQFPRALRKEFAIANFKLDHQQPHLFFAFQWQRNLELPHWSYALYRWAWALYHVGWWVASIVTEGGAVSTLARKAYFFIYLTNWAYTIIALLNLFWAGVVTVELAEFGRTEQVKKVMTWPLKVVWTLQNLVYLPSLFITAAYWGAVYNPEYPIDVVNAAVHICNSIYVLIELMTSAAPTRILHFPFPTLMLTSYLGFTLIYWATGSTTPDGLEAIYPIMDWNNLSLTLPFVVGCFVCLPVMQ